MTKDIIRQLNWVDIFAIILFVRSSYVGVKAGLTKEIFKTAGILTAVVFSYYFYKVTADFLSTYTLISRTYSELITFIIIAVFTVAVFAILRIIIFKVLKMQFIPKVEMIGGGLLGVIRGVFVCGLILMALLLIPAQYLTESINQRSLSAPYILKATETVYSKLVRFYPLRQETQPQEKTKPEEKKAKETNKSN